MRNKNKKHFLAFYTMWHTGGRCRDIVLFRKEDVRKDEITFRKSKGGKDRVVPIDEGLFNMLSLYA